MIDKTLRFCHGRPLWQKPFAEICREIIVPAIKKMMEDERSDGNANA